MKKNEVITYLTLYNSVEEVDKLYKYIDPRVGDEIWYHTSID